MKKPQDEKTHKLEDLLTLPSSEGADRSKNISSMRDTKSIEKTEQTIQKLSYRMNLKMSQDRANLLAMDLYRHGWTEQEIADAADLIHFDADLSALVRFTGVISASHFTAAKEKLNTRPTLGQCFHIRDEYARCNNPGTIRDWGEVYCETCWDRHVVEMQASGHDAGLNRIALQKEIRALKSPPTFKQLSE